MTVHTTSTPTLPTAPRRFGRNAVLATIGGTIVLAATVTGVLMVRSANREPVSAPVAVVAEPAFTSVVVSASSSDGPHTVYVVGTEEEAATIRTGLSEAVRIRATVGEMSLPEMESVVVASSDDDAAAVVQGINEANGIRADAGLPAYAVLDLRGK